MDVVDLRRTRGTERGGGTEGDIFSSYFWPLSDFIYPNRDGN